MEYNPPVSGKNKLLIIIILISIVFFITGQSYDYKADRSHQSIVHNESDSDTVYDLINLAEIYYTVL